MATFGERLRLLREEQKMAQKEIASLLGLTYSAIGKYETDSNKPSSDTIHKLADYFHVSSDYLLGRSNIRLSAEELIDQNKDMISDLPETARKEIIDFVGYIRNKYGDSKTEWITNSPKEKGGASHDVGRLSKVCDRERMRLLRQFPRLGNKQTRGWIIV
jgi:transcriptional regulator with XRE-family HTH domain